MVKNDEFTSGGILSPLLRFTLPVLAALFLQSMYGAVDVLVVGQFGTAADVSAVSTGSQLLQTITSMIVGLSMGTTILLAQKIGEKKQSEAGQVVGGAICLFALLGVAVTALIVSLAAPFASLLQAPPEAFDKTVDYIRICGGGSLFIVAYNVLGSVFRGMGDSKTPLFAVFVACVLNIGGDLLFVGVFGMAAAGAAIATVLSQVVSVALCAVLIFRRDSRPIEMSRRDVKLSKKIVWPTLKLGFPIALQDALVSISFLVIAAIVNSLGVIASAGVGVSEKLCAFIMLVPSAFMQSLSAFVGQNVGAGKLGRARKALGIGMLCSFAIGIVLAYLSFFHGDALASIFAADPEVVAAAWEYLRAYSIDTLLVSFLFCFCGYFNGRGKTAFVMAQGIVGAFLVRIPVSFMMSRVAPVSLFLVGLATPCSTLVQITLFAIYFIFTLRRDKISRTQITESEVQ